MKEFVEFVLVGALSCLVILGSFSLVAFAHSRTNIEGAEPQLLGTADTSPQTVFPTVPDAERGAPVLASQEMAVSDEADGPVLITEDILSKADDSISLPEPVPTPPSQSVVVSSNNRTVDAPLDSTEVKDILALHNSARKEVGVPSLRWSQSLTDSAQSWARELAAQSCSLKHSGGPTGETIYYSKKTGSNQTPRVVHEIMDAFLNEKKFYNYDTHSCKAGEICGHYTQIVWADTTHVGCARSLCLGDEREEIWVCHFDPQGNIEGVRPY